MKVTKASGRMSRDGATVTSVRSQQDWVTSAPESVSKERPVYCPVVVLRFCLVPTVSETCPRGVVLRPHLLATVDSWRRRPRLAPHEAVVDAHEVLLGDDNEAELIIQHDVPVHVGLQIGRRTLLVDHIKE